jgi:agmatinase
MDIVEVSPPYDCADITAILANRVALEVLSALAHKKNNKNGTTYNAKRNLLDR